MKQCATVHCKNDASRYYMLIVSPTTATFRNKRVKSKDSKASRIYYCEKCIKKLDDREVLPEGKVFQVDMRQVQK